MTAVAYYTEKLLGRIFYFCLAKTGDRQEAEELAADISLEVLESLSRAPEPDLLEPWVFAIARRRYARWCSRRIEARASLAPAVDGDAPELPSGLSLEDSVIAKEEFELLRRELAFVAREHRELLVAHYIEGVPLATLARRLGIPVGTVKTRLMRARKLLKEGMNMTREFGKRSYNPEALSFTASGSQPDGLPWKAINRKIPVNILCAASGAPRSADELAMELGIALPYMEDEICHLVNATLLKRLDSKPERFITGFFIADVETQDGIYSLQKSSSPERARLLLAAISEVKEELRALLRYGISELDFMWLTPILMYDELLCEVGVSSKCGIKRPNGGTWGFMGMERGGKPREEFHINHSGTGDSELGTLWRYSAAAFGFTGEPFGCSELRLLADFTVNDRRVSSVSEGESSTFEAVCRRFAHVEGDRLVPDIAVYPRGAVGRSRELILSTEPGRELAGQMRILFGEVQSVLRKCTNPILHETLGFYASAFMYDTRGMVLNDLVASGGIAVPARDSKAGIYLRLGE